jgi:hypothetical protein
MHKEVGPSNRPNIDNMKMILRFLLPMVGQSLGSYSLISLLCLDSASREFDLGLEFESLWEAELTSSNVIEFLIACLQADDALRDLTLELAEVENLVIPAMRYIESRTGQQLPGRFRLHEIVKRLFESGRDLKWVSACGGVVLQNFTSGINEKLLQRNRSKRNTEQVFGFESEEV